VKDLLTEETVNGCSVGSKIQSR